MNTVLIISDEYDGSTNHVIDWLSSYGCDFIRINETDILTLVEFTINNDYVNIVLEYNCFGIQKTFSLNQIKSVWYRRGKLNLNYKYFEDKNKNIQNSINQYLIKEKKSIENFIDSYLQSKKHINSFSDNFTNKLYNLFVASTLGLRIPETIITENKNCLSVKLPIYKNAITKAITQSELVFNSKQSASYYTVFVNKKYLTKVPMTFSRSLLQPCLDKAYELRIFFLHGKCYAMAIFSQNDSKTKVDFRNYNFEKPNRAIPYKLPNDIIKKLKLLMGKLNMNCGSIDIVVTKNKEYIFLEVNPVGQFQQVSLPCNFYLEKVIAKYLI